MIERLLSISGEDTLTVNRKYRDQWTGKLPCRLHVLSNELPKLGDASMAIVGRIVLLLTTRSWLGKEDHDLEPALQRELTGILNWSLATGWRASRTTAVASPAFHRPTKRSSPCAISPLQSPPSCASVAGSTPRRKSRRRSLRRLLLVGRRQRPCEADKAKLRPLSCGRRSRRSASHDRATDVGLHDNNNGGAGTDLRGRRCYTGISLLRVCAQCGKADGREERCFIGGEEAWLHPECQRVYGGSQ